MMAKSTLATVATILFVLAIEIANAEYDVANKCKLVPTGTKLPSIDSCQLYYTCNAFGAQPTATNCSNTQAFDKDSQSCKAASSVNCYYGIENPCENKNMVYVPNVSDCTGWIWCVNSAEKGRGKCAKGQLFDPSTSSCIYGTCADDGKNDGENDVQNLCDIMQSGQYFGSFDDCTQWNVCTNSDMTTGNCGTGLVYNTERRMCLKNDGTMCERTEGNVPVLPTAKCDSTTKNAKTGDANVCSIWYICDGTQWKKQKSCPTGQYFDEPTGVCKSRQSATPATGCDRCQFTTSTWVNAVDVNCQDYLTCKAGVEVNKGTCAEDQFFNEQRQACVVGTTNLENYKKTNGACAGSETSTTIDDATTEVTKEEEASTEKSTTEKSTTEETKTEKPTTEETATTDPPAGKV